MPFALVIADGSAAKGCRCRVFARQSPAALRGCPLRASATWRGSRQALWLRGRAPVLRRAATRLHAVNKIDKLNTEELEVAIQERTKPLIVDFFATWCGPCVLLAKELEQVAAELGDEVRIVKVDVDEEQGLASHLQIQGLPTLVFIGMDKEKPALRLEGLLPASAIKDVLVDLTAPKALLLTSANDGLLTDLTAPEIDARDMRLLLAGSTCVQGGDDEPAAWQAGRRLHGARPAGCHELMALSAEAERLAQ